MTSEAKHRGISKKQEIGDWAIQGLPTGHPAKHIHVPTQEAKHRASEAAIHELFQQLNGLEFASHAEARKAADILNKISPLIDRSLADERKLREELVGALRLAQLWLANCTPVVALDGPKPLPVIREVLKHAEAEGE